MKYAVIIEKGETSFGAHVPDLPGCVAVGKTEKEVKELITEAVQLPVDQLKADGEAVPKPQFRVTYVEAVS